MPWAFLIVLCILSAIWVLVTRARFNNARERCMHAYHRMTPVLEHRRTKYLELIAAARQFPIDEEEAISVTQMMAVRTEKDNGLDYHIGSEAGLEMFAAALRTRLDMYPSVHENETMRKIWKSIDDMEPEVRKAVGEYNAAVREYNRMISVPGSNVIRDLFHYETMPAYEEPEDADENTIKIAF
ncbi:MAG: LemA family protein [Solobacterium sp.]|nr:LemA family protein [Solobacterium sp.]